MRENCDRLGMSAMLGTRMRAVCQVSASWALLHLGIFYTEGPLQLHK